jgi:hypothetical protein
VNTRGINFRGGLGKINFSTTVLKGRFAGYFNRYAESIKPAGGNPAIIPGIELQDLKLPHMISLGSLNFYQANYRFTVGLR